MIFSHSDNPFFFGPFLECGVFLIGEALSASILLLECIILSDSR